VNAQVKKHLGYEVFGYFLFFQEEDAAELMEKNLDPLASLFSSDDSEIGKRYMGAVGGFREFLTEGKVVKRAEFISDEYIMHFKEAFSPSNGGFAAAINWYRAALQNINDSDDKEIPEANLTIQQPTLLFTGHNFISASADFPKQMKPFVPNLRVENLDTGHWMTLEKPDEVNNVLKEFIEG